MDQLLPFADIVISLCEARRRAKPVESQQAAERVPDVAKQVIRVKDDVEQGRITSSAISRETAFRGSKTIDQLRKQLREWFEFYKGYDPMFTWWVEAEHRKTDDEMQQLATAISKSLVHTGANRDDDIIGEPIGREGLLSDLEAEMIPYSPDQLIEISDKEDAWCRKEIKQAARELGFGNDWHAALEHVKRDYVEPGKQPQLVNELLNEGIRYVKDNDLLTVPPLVEELGAMYMLSPEAQRVSPFFLGGGDLLVSYPTNDMEFEDKLMTMRGNNRHFSRATVFHEWIPGHHLQMYMLDRCRPYRQLFDTPFWMEGWALYWEFVLWEKGFFDSAEDRVGTLFWRMHRCARIKFSLKFHLGEWSPQQCIDYLVEHVQHERSTAEGEVRRSFTGDYSPLYQAGYMLGALQFVALRRELVDGGFIEEKVFHDFILKQNMMPVELLRTLLNQQALARDFKPSWRFYDVHSIAKRLATALVSPQ